MILMSIHTLNKRLFDAVGWPGRALMAGLMLSAFVSLLFRGPRHPAAQHIVFDALRSNPFVAVRVDARIDPAAARILEDGSALYPVGSPEGVPQMFAWCERPSEVPREVVGPVLGWLGAHELPPAIVTGLAEARRVWPDSPSNPAVIAVDGCRPGEPVVPREQVQPANGPLPARYTLFFQDLSLDRSRITPLPDGTVLVPITPDGSASPRVSAWMSCTGELRPENRPNLFGGVKGHVGSGTLPATIQRAIADAEAAGWAITEPWAPVIDVGRCGR